MWARLHPWPNLAREGACVCACVRMRLCRGVCQRSGGKCVLSDVGTGWWCWDGAVAVLCEELGRLVSARRTAPRREQKADLPASQGPSDTYSFM